jgi:hypothetical protein
MPSNIVIPDDPHYHDDLEAELEHERYELARKRITVSDLLSEVDSLIAAEPDDRKHPLFRLALYCLRNGSYLSTGKRSHLAELIADKYEALIDRALEHLIEEELQSGVTWND